MAKSVKKEKEPRKPFVIPTIQEISDCMFEYTKRKKINWPKGFCDWYAEKFFNSYEKSGWRLSAGKGGPVKNWQACFKSEWVTLKYSGDISMLDKLTPKIKPVDRDTLDFVNEILTEYRQNKDSIDEIRTASCYEWCKEQGFFLRLTQDQRQECIEISKKDLTNARSCMVRYLFDYMVSNLLTFNYFFNEVTQ